MNSQISLSVPVTPPDFKQTVFLSVLLRHCLGFTDRACHNELYFWLKSRNRSMTSFPTKPPKCPFGQWGEEKTDDVTSAMSTEESGCFMFVFSERFTRLF